MTIHDDTRHLSAETLQEFLEGELRAEARERAEEHLAACRRCASELEGWEAVFEELGTLPAYAPHEGFAARVMTHVEVPRPVSLAERLRARLLPSRAAHVDEAALAGFAEGALSPRKAARVRAHVDACPACAREAVAWRRLFTELDTLPRYGPTEGFADAVMTGVRMPVTVPARPSALPSFVGGMAVAARKLLPRTRRAWAALSGAAVTPAVTIALVAYAVFSHPTLTPGALASFVWWQLADLAGGAWTAVGSAALEGMRGSGVYVALDQLVASPLAVVGLVGVYATLTLLAARILYRNLRPTSSVHRHHA